MTGVLAVPDPVA